MIDWITRRHFTLSALAACLVLILGPALAADPATETETRIGGRFVMQDQTGKIVTDEDFRGKFMLIFFGYAFCPDICPTALGTVAAALDILGKDGESLTPVFATLDPRRDNPQRLWDFTRAFHPRLIGLTGSPEMTERLARSYKVTYKVVPGAKDRPEDYLIDHSAGLYLMDPTGKFRVKYLHGMGAEDLAARLKEQLAR